MTIPSRMPRYDVRNDGMGPYAIFYCESCEREFRSQADLKNTISSDIGRKAASDLLRKVPLFGGALAEQVTGQDPRYIYTLTADQLTAHWAQVKDRFRECPTCKRVVCISDFDEQSGYCNDDTPRRNEIAESHAEQAGAVARGLANAFGLGDTFKDMGSAMRQAGQAAQQAGANMARCPQDDTLAAPGTKFCPECGAQMVQPVVLKCDKCGREITGGVKFCPDCGTPVKAAPAAGICVKCGAETKGAKFCPECGNKVG